MRKLLPLILTCLMLLTGCETAPRVQASCPAIPPLDQLPAAQVPSFTETMRNFLSGSLGKPTGYELTLPNAKLPTVQPEKN